MKSPVANPLNRSFTTAAYDDARGQVVLFGGAGSGDVNVGDSWVWDGVEWTKKNPVNSPAPRWASAMVYDAARQQVVLFGGGGSGGNETWVWGGANWAQKNPTNSPSPRNAHAMVYDAARQQVVLFGGSGNSGTYSSGTYLNDTWVWDGTNWIPKSPSAAPSPRQLHAMVYDASRSQVVMFGGRLDGTFLNDTWVWDGTNWTQKNLSNGPTARSAHAMAFDESSGQVVLFGGYGGAYVNDTWVWNGNIWTLKSPSSSAAARDGHVMVYDAARGQVVLFGGWICSGTCSYMNDTWVWPGGKAACTVSLPAPSITIGAVAFTGSLTVSTSGPNCPWTAVTATPDWLQVTTGGSGTTTGQVGYSASANLTPANRVGSITVGGRVFTVTQTPATPVVVPEAACTLSLPAPSITIGAVAFTGSLTVSTSGPNCPWTAAATTPDWLQVTTGSSGTTTGQVGYSASANLTPANRVGSITVGGRVFTVTQTPAVVARVALSLSRTTLAFGGVVGGTSLTPPQEVSIGMTGGRNNWTAVSSAVWLIVTPASGAGSGGFSASIVPLALLTPGTYNGRITVSASGATNGPFVVNCTLTLSAKSTTSGPFGAFDTPADNAKGIAGNIALTGWALDDVGVKSVTLWRDPVGLEPAHDNGYIYIADALFVPGARPDVEAANSGSPNADRAGWGYLMLTNVLPNATGPQGNGTFKLHAIATDDEGHQFELGSKTITVDNFGSKKPFGTLDTPAPGQTVSGTILNWGWAMTPPPAFIAVDGSKIWVAIDGVTFAHPNFGIKRADIAAAFPGYSNSETGVGVYNLDTTKYANGIHSLGWLVYDNLGRVDGIGSRYIQIQNTVAAPGGASPLVVEEAIEAERAFRLRMARQNGPSPSVAGYPAFRRGYDLDAPLTPIRQAGEGLLVPIELDELDRLEIHLPAGQQWSAALRVGDELRDLPIGSTFDAEGGIFYWQIGPAFLGQYLLEFLAADGSVLLVPVGVGPGQQRGGEPQHQEGLGRGDYNGQVLFP